MKFPDNITIISDEVSQDLPVISAFVREFRLPGIELRSLNGRAFKDLTRADVAEVAAASRAEGWRVVGCATPVFKCDLDDPAAIAAPLPPDSTQRGASPLRRNPIRSG